MTDKERDEAMAIDSEYYRLRSIVGSDVLATLPHLFATLIKRRDLCQYAFSSGSKSTREASEIVFAKKQYDNEIMRLLNIKG